jgi:hypothetical protein
MSDHPHSLAFPAASAPSIRAMGARRQPPGWRWTPLLAALLAACGGGGGSDGDNTVTPSLPATAGQLLGTAATGAALAGANVAITDASGAQACQEASVVSTAAGNYACTVLADKAAPYVVVVTDPSGAHAPLVSVATATPAAGSTLIVNASPLTTAIIGQLLGSDPLGAVSHTGALNAAALDALKAKVTAQLAAALASLGAPEGYDPFSTPITAATSGTPGNAADHVLDLLRITGGAGNAQVSTVDNPSGAVALADTSAATPAPLPSAAAGVSTLAEALRQMVPALNTCYAVPAAQRVLATNTSLTAADGGPEITDVAQACEFTVHPAYLNNGYSAGQAFRAMLNDATLDGAVFHAPEITLFIPAATAGESDRAIVNLRYTTQAGLAGNVITVAQRFEGAAAPAARGPGWYLYGNQHPVDTSIGAFVRRMQQLVPSPGTAPFSNAAASRFESGLTFFINKDGPRSNGLRAARVTGPGLPAAGLVYTPPNASICTDQNWLNIRRKDGQTDPAQATPAADTGTVYRLQRTVGLSGTESTTLRANTGATVAGSPTSNLNWAHPSDYGAALGAVDFINYAALTTGANYLIEMFYDGETTPRYSVHKRLLAPAIRATRAAALPWVSLTEATLAYLDPLGAWGGAQATIPLAWARNPAAEDIRSAGVYTASGGISTIDGTISVARGATTALSTAPGAAAGCAGGATFPALTADGSSSRQFQLRYRTSDGSTKDATWRYN